MARFFVGADLPDRALDPLHAVFFRDFAEEPGISTGIDVIGIVNGQVRQYGELVVLCRNQFRTISTEVLADSLLTPL